MDGGREEKKGEKEGGEKGGGKENGTKLIFILMSIINKYPMIRSR